jgi:hypothetical protein
MVCASLTGTKVVLSGGNGRGGGEKVVMERSGRAEPGKAVTNAALSLDPLANGRYDELDALNSLFIHWPEYLMEAVGLGLFMFFVCAFAVLLQHPNSPVRHALVSAFVRRAFMGLAVGVTMSRSS